MGFKSLYAASRGFSLIELLSAMTVFTVGLLAVATMQLTAIRANASAQSVTMASTLAEGALEEILALDRSDSLFVSDRIDFLWASYDESGNSVAEAAQYQARCGIDADYGQPDLTRVQVTVISPGRSFHSQTLVGFKRLP